MKLKDAQKLESGQKVMHDRYGECSVKEVIIADGSNGELFGVVITPITETGRHLLSMDSETDIPDFLEDSIRTLSNFLPGSKPIDLETIWAVPAEDLPKQEPKEYFEPHDEKVL